jgi:HK97 family phage major capsid protein
VNDAQRRLLARRILGWDRKGRPVYAIAGGSIDADDKTDTPTLPYTLEDLRGRTPEELSKIVEGLDERLRALHQTPDGELRVLDETEQRAMTLGLEIRAQAMAMLEEHRKIAEVFRTKPRAVQTPLRNLINADDADPFSAVRSLSVKEARDRALRVLDSREAAAHLEDDQKAQVAQHIRRETDIARRILVTEHEDYRTAWMKAVCHPQGPALWTEDERQAMRAWEEYRAMSEGTSAAGGYGIPVFIDPSIILTAQGSGNPFLQIARQVPVNTNAWKGVTSAGVTWSFDAEASAVSDDSPTLAQPAVTVFMARGFIPYSIEVGQDYPGFADEMATLLAEGYDELLVDKFSRGSGSGEPQGIITALDADTTSEVLLTTAGAFGEVDVYNTWKALPQRFRNRRAAWMMSVGVNNAVRRFGTANVFHASTINLQDEWVDRLMNRQVYESPYFPDVVGTTGHTNQLVVGDFNNYVIARRGGMSVELVPTLFDVTNNRPTGQRGWFAYARIGGGAATTASFKLLNQT